MKEYYIQSKTKYFSLFGIPIFIGFLIVLIGYSFVRGVREYFLFWGGFIFGMLLLLAFRLQLGIHNPITVADDLFVLPPGKVLLCRSIRDITLQRELGIPRCFSVNYEKDCNTMQFKIHLNGIDEEFSAYMFKKANQFNIPYWDKTKR